MIINHSVLAACYLLSSIVCDLQRRISVRRATSDATAVDNVFLIGTLMTASTTVERERTSSTNTWVNTWVLS